MFNIGPLELLVILIVVLIVFGPNRLPEVAKAMGKAVNEFKKATNSAQQALNDVSRQISDAESAEKKEPVESTPSRPEDFLKAVQEEEVAAQKPTVEQKRAEAADLKGQAQPGEQSAVEGQARTDEEQSSYR